jgi:hypothetical protein
MATALYALQVMYSYDLVIQVMYSYDLVIQVMYSYDLVFATSDIQYMHYSAVYSWESAGHLSLGLADKTLWLRATREAM